MLNQPNDHPLPLSAIIRQRRTQLELTQAQLADVLRVTAEAVGLWEGAKRRVELNRVPRLAAALQLEQQDVCRLALYQYYPCLHAALFGSERPPQPRNLSQQ
jgi:transcriptional regulator with XRE-family HTH domain